MELNHYPDGNCGTITAQFIQIIQQRREYLHEICNAPKTVVFLLCLSLLALIRREKHFKNFSCSFTIFLPNSPPISRHQRQNIFCYQTITFLVVARLC